jgi:hypothetical protein
MEGNTDHWNEKRQRIYDWMVANDQISFADLYKGAVINLCTRTPGYVRFVSHAVRDLMNGMAASKKEINRGQTQYVQIVNTLFVSWSKHNLPRGSESFEAADSVVTESPDLLIPNEVVGHIQTLLREHEQGRRRSEDSPYLFFEMFLPNAVSRDAIPEPYPTQDALLRLGRFEYKDLVQITDK